MKPCPNCKTELAPGTAVCPNCGADTRALWQLAYDLPQMEGMPALGARRRADKWHFAGGFFLTLILSCLIPILMIGSGISLLIYFFAARDNPAFKKGAGWGTVAGIFGAIAVCTSVIRY